MTGTGEIGSPVSFSMLDAGGSWATFIDASASGAATFSTSMGASATGAVSETALGRNSGRKLIGSRDVNHNFGVVDT